MPRGMPRLIFIRFIGGKDAEGDAEGDAQGDAEGDAQGDAEGDAQAYLHPIYWG